MSPGVRRRKRDAANWRPKAASCKGAQKTKPSRTTGTLTWEAHNESQRS